MIGQNPVFIRNQSKTGRQCLPAAPRDRTNQATGGHEVRVPGKRPRALRAASARLWRRLTCLFLAVVGRAQFQHLCGSVYSQGNVVFTPDGNSVLSPVGNRITRFDLIKCVTSPPSHVCE
jgi:hypothetical protein